MKKVVEKYFKLFSNRDLIGLEKLFTNNVILQDWTTNIKSKKKVLKFNEKIFKSFKKVSVNLEESFTNLKNNSIACKITVQLNKKKLKVIDIIYFDKKNKIKKIVAYLG